MGTLARLYGGFFVVDVRLVMFGLFLSLLLSAATVLPLRRVSQTSRVLLLMAALWVVYFLVSLGVLGAVFDYPVIRIQSFFELP